MSGNLKKLAGSCFYVGYIPGAPGTYCSLLAAAVFILVGEPLHLGGWLGVLGMVVAAMWALRDAPGLFGSEDPKVVVIDEAAGMWVTFLVGGSAGWIFLVLGIVIFRILDILKPFPIHRIEKMGGWEGIMCDDLFAGFVAGVVVRLASYLAV